MNAPVLRSLRFARHAVLATSLVVLAAQADAASRADDFELDNAPSAGAMAFDLVVVRPLSFVALVIGSGLFVLQLPLDLIQGRAPVDPAQKLVVEPARYTFDRPLGQMDH